MEIQFEERPEAMRVPKPLLIGAAVLMTATMALSGTSRVTGAGGTRIAAPTAAQTVAARDVRIADRADGAVVVTDAATGQEVHVVAPGSNSFIRGALRGLAFDRRKNHVGPEAPFHIALGTDGRLTFQDPSTGDVLDLDAYGADNAREFATLLPLSKVRIRYVNSR